MSTYVQASCGHVRDDCEMETIDCGCGAVSTRQPVIQRRNGKAVSEYNSDVMDEGAIITDVTDEERTCLLGGGAGRSPIDRVIGGLRDRKGLVVVRCINHLSIICLIVEIAQVTNTS